MERRRGVTRSYAVALITAACVVGVALVVAVWGALSLWTGRHPVERAGVAVWIAPVLIIATIALLATTLWRQTIMLLRGHQRPALELMMIAAAGSYLVWCLGGTLAGMTIAETWLSPYALALAVAWLLTSLAFWGVLMRRIYSDRPTPRWPWERAGEDGAS